jgi:hypothetical protein
MSLTVAVGKAALKKLVGKEILVGYQIVEYAAELAQDYRVQQDKISGPLVRELNSLLRIDKTSATEGKDYFYFSAHGLKGAAFAWNKAGNAIAFRIKSSTPDAIASIGRTYYLVTMFPLVIQPADGLIEVLAHARSGRDNDVFFTAVLNDLNETAGRMKSMTNPSRGLYMTP